MSIRILLTGLLQCSLIRCRDKQWLVSKSSLNHWLLKLPNSETNIVCTLKKEEVVVIESGVVKYPFQDLNIHPFKMNKVSMIDVNFDEERPPLLKENSDDKLFLWRTTEEYHRAEYKLFACEREYWNEWQNEMIRNNYKLILSPWMKLEVQDHQNPLRSFFLSQASPVTLPDMPWENLKALFANQIFVQTLVEHNKWLGLYVKELQAGYHEVMFVSPEICWKELTDEWKQLQEEDKRQK